jgi:hypothetical protein
VLVTSAVKIVGDSTTGVSWILLPNASWPEAFLPLFDVVGGALHMRKDLSQKQRESWDTKRSRKQVLTYLVADLRPGMQGFGGAFFTLLCDQGRPPDRCLT